jgi:hypothetical protein
MRREVRVVHAERDEICDVVIAWLECGCKHMLVEISGHSIESAKASLATPVLVLQYMRDISDVAHELFAASEGRMIEAQSRCVWLDAFMKGRPPTS